MTKADIYSQNVILNNIETELRKIKNYTSKFQNLKFVYRFFSLIKLWVSQEINCALSITYAFREVKFYTTVRSIS